MYHISSKLTKAKTNIKLNVSKLATQVISFVFFNKYVTIRKGKVQS